MEGLPFVVSGIAAPQPGTRQQLYDRAWRTPLDTPVRDSGSGCGIGKLGERYDIAVLAERLVAKKAWGHNVKQDLTPSRKQ